MSRSVLAALAVDARARASRVHARASSSASWSTRAPELLAVEVHKRRGTYTVGGAWPSCSELRTDRRASLRTIAVESEDPALVIAAVRELGLDLAAERQRARGA